MLFLSGRGIADVFWGCSHISVQREWEAPFRGKHSVSMGEKSISVGFPQGFPSWVCTGHVCGFIYLFLFYFSSASRFSFSAAGRYILPSLAGVGIARWFAWAFWVQWAKPPVALLITLYAKQGASVGSSQYSWVISDDPNLPDFALKKIAVSQVVQLVHWEISTFFWWPCFFFPQISSIGWRLKQLVLSGENKTANKLQKCWLHWLCANTMKAFFFPSH